MTKGPHKAVGQPQLAHEGHRPRRRQEADRGGYDMPRVSHSKTLVFLLVHLTSHVAGMAELAGQQAEERCYVKRKPERTNGTGWSGEEEETD
ncbi:hypothetical protein Cadr_000008097 [Camelus dromedarius]|uniref:Uncharacterized protein n=1 Tax=Camelus dromedarius TaxID=9838 RepID=A0A5N4DYV9_CAMDR|nr:hypothetical protein Cadr_000008097 [Camelus dromedarius]